MKVVVTGAAGFIGSHLCERLLADGHQVTGIDALTDYYPRSQKEQNIAGLKTTRGFRFIEADLLQMRLAPLVDDIEIVFHLAAQPGVRPSWGKEFDRYVQGNILATQRLLDAVAGRKLTKFVYASSSSVYGDAESFPTPETAQPKPISPYGATKLAGEQLGYLYARQYGVPVVSVRYFSVYGPRQRPDMAFHRFIRAYLTGGELEVYGDGEQIRDYTHVSDIVEGTVRALRSQDPGAVFNIGGGHQVTVNQVLGMLDGLIQRRPVIRRKSAQAGDARRTCADVSRAKDLLGYVPSVTLSAGLHSEVSWLEGWENGRSAGPEAPRSRSGLPA
jgi:UDP-glucose 4-epimerase